MMRRDRRGERGVAVWQQLPLQGSADASTADDLWENFGDLWNRIIGPSKFECTCEWCDPVSGKRPNTVTRYWDGTCDRVRGTPVACNGTNDASRAVPCGRTDVPGTPAPREIVT